MASLLDLYGVPALYAKGWDNRPPTSHFFWKGKSLCGREYRRGLGLILQLDKPVNGCKRCEAKWHALNGGKAQLPELDHAGFAK